MATRQLTVVLAGDARAATRAFKETGDSAEREAGRIGPAFRTAGSALSGAMGPAAGEALETLEKFGPALDAIKEKGATAGQKLGGVGLGIAGLGGTLAMIGSGSKAADQQLEQALENSGHSLDEFSDRIDSTVGSMAKFGYEDDEVKGSLQTLTQATNDPKKALDLMSTAADLAASKHVSLQSASESLAKIMGGRGSRDLALYGIEMDGVGTKSEQGERAIGQLSDKVKGQASASADTFAGKLKGIKANLGNLTGDIGAKYGPTITAAGVATTGLGAATDLLKGPLSKAASGISSAGSAAMTAATSLKASLGPAIVSAVSSGWAWVTQLWAQAAAMVAAYWPIIAIIAGVALLIAGIVLLAKNWDTVWNFVKQVAGDVWHWLEDNVIHPVAAAFDRYMVQPVRTALGFVGDAFTAVKGTITDQWNAAKGVVSAGVDFIVGIPDKIRTGFETVANIMTAPFRVAFNGIATLWNSTVGKLSFSIPSWVPGVGGKGWDVPDMPTVQGFADGTSFAPGGVALVGERGPELMTVPRGASITPAAQTARILGAPPVTQNITYHVSRPVDVEELSRANAWHVRLAMLATR